VEKKTALSFFSGVGFFERWQKVKVLFARWRFSDGFLMVVTIFFSLWVTRYISNFITVIPVN